jgi:hypothetical protein
MPNLGENLSRYALLCNLFVFRDELQMDLFGTLFPSSNKLKTQPYKSRISKLENEAKKQVADLTRALAWLIEGLDISESWIENLPFDAGVANYLNFRLQGAINHPPIAATSNNPRNQYDAANPRLQGARPHNDDAANLVVQGVHRLSITEFEEM